MGRNRFFRWIHNLTGKRQGKWVSRRDSKQVKAGCIVQRTDNKNTVIIDVSSLQWHRMFEFPSRTNQAGDSVESIVLLRGRKKLVGAAPIIKKCGLLK